MSKLEESKILEYFAEYVKFACCGAEEAEKMKLAMLLFEIGKQYGYRITSNEPEPLGSFDDKHFNTINESLAFFECQGCSVERLSENKEIYRVFSEVFQEEGLITYDSDADEYVFETV